MDDEFDRLRSRLERNPFGAGNDPHHALFQALERGHIGPAPFVTHVANSADPTANPPTASIDRDGVHASAGDLGTDANVAVDDDGLLVTDSSDTERVRLGHLGSGDFGLRITNSASVVIIDGTSNVLKEVATGLLAITGPNAGTTSSTVTLALGFTTTTVHHGWFDITGRAEILPRITTLDDIRQFTEIIATDKTRVTLEWTSTVDRSGDNRTGRFKVMKEAAF